MTTDETDRHPVYQEDNTKQIVIVGGGIGGLMLATRLARRFRRQKDVRVILVDRTAVHVWKPMLHTFAAGIANAHEDGIPFVAQAKRAGFTYLPGEFYAIGTDAQTISLRITDLPDRPLLDHTIRYDALVLAIGSQAHDFGTEGVQDNCHFIDSLHQAEALNKAIREEIVYRLITGGDVEIAVVGGGATGVEFAAETARLVELGESFGAFDLTKRLKLTLLDAGPRILASFPEGVSQRAAETLGGLGVTIRSDAQVASADRKGFALKDGSRVDAAIRVWAAGVKAPDVLSSVGAFETSRGGQVVVRPTLQSVSSPAVFAMGDCASLTPDGAERPLPPTGQVARQQADHLTKAIPAYLNGESIRTFRYKDMGSLVSLSQYGAYGSLAKQGVVPTIAIRGWFAMRAHDLFYRMHQFGLFGPFKGSVLVLRDALDSLVRPGVRLD
ncbi:MAG: FAD-dependent oxidoreductase [Pseudomonadota bacterium]